MLKLFNGDCIEQMKNIPDESIDMVLCDLPYEETGAKWDKKFDLDGVCRQFERVIKEEGCIALTCSFRFGVRLFNLLPHLYKYDWIYEKEHGSNIHSLCLQPLRVHEQILIFGKGRVSNGKRTPMKYNPQKTLGKPYTVKQGRNTEVWREADTLNHGIITTNKDGLRHPRTVQKFSRDRDKFHPTQKPIALLEMLIKSYTDEGDVVLDCCMGSGSTGVACVNTKRDFIGIELDKNYFDIAENRIKEAQKQVRLF